MSVRIAHIVETAGKDGSVNVARDSSGYENPNMAINMFQVESARFRVSNRDVSCSIGVPLPRRLEKSDALGRTPMQSENPWSLFGPEGKYLSAGISDRLSQGSLTVFCSPEQRVQGEQILARAEECSTQVGHFFGAGYRPEIVICLYPSQAEMERAFGRKLPGDQCCFAPIKGPRSLVALASQIARDHLMQVLAHEISHVYFTLMTGNREVNEVQQTVPVWLDEGLALWVDGHFRRDLRGVRARRRALLQEGLRRGDSLRLRDMYTYFNRLDPGEELGPKGQMAHAFSDSCVTRLMEIFGIESVFRFLELLPDGANFERAFFRHFRTELEQFNEEMVREVLGPRMTAR